MNLRLRTFPVAVGLGLVLAVAPARAADNPDSARDDDPVKPAAKTLRTAETAREIIGQDVASRDGVKLGELQDLVVNAKGGRIAYALVSSGGVLGFGAELRAVPFAAFKDTYDPDGNLTLDLEHGDWTSIPTLGEEPLASLADEALIASTFRAFGEQPPSDLRGGNSRGNLVRVSEITGREVLSQGEEVGEIEDVIVNIQQQRASALLDPEDDITGSERKLVVGFDRLRLEGGDDSRLVTDLSRDELRRATPSRQDWWAADPGYPYVWTGYGTIAATTYSNEAVGVSPQVARNQATAGEAAVAAAPSGMADAVTDEPARTLPGRPSANVVAGAVHANPKLPDTARRTISVEERDGVLVVSGTVESSEVKGEVTRTVTQAAEGGWEIDNRIEVRGAAE